MDDLVNLELAAEEVSRRSAVWCCSGIDVGPVTWRDQGEGWPPSLKTDPAEVRDADSIGVLLRKGDQEGEVVLFKGGWCDYAFWTGRVEDDVEQDAPGWPNEMTVERFGDVLDRLAASFE